MDKKKIMLIDDDKELLDELKTVLEMNGYDALTIDNSGLALDIAKEIMPDIVVLDLNMPRLSGLYLAGELMRANELKSTMIMAMSGYYKTGDASLLKIHGIKALLTKPFHPQDLLDCIKEL